MPGSPSITQPLVINALKTLGGDNPGWHTHAEIAGQIAADGDQVPTISLTRSLRELADLGLVLRRWDYPPHQSRRRVYCIARPTRKESS